MDTNLRPSGIEGLGDMGWGTHFCLFYDTKEDLLNILVPYVRAGLENHEFFLCVASPPLSTQEAQRAMHEAIPDFERYLAEGQIEIVSYRGWFLTGGEFDTQQVLQNWIAKLNWALAKGYAGLRFLGDPSWLDEQAWGSVPEFEKQLDLIVSNSQMLGLCAYALERCSAADVLDVVNHHQFTVAMRDRGWEHLESSELKRAHEEIRQLNADLERRVVERTAQLAATNEQLKLEITARKAAEESLREAQARTESVLASVADTHILLDRQWRYIYLNEAAIRAIGKSREQILGRTLWELYPDIVGTELDYQYRRAMDERLTVVFDFHYEVQDTWWANRFYPTPEGLAIFATEITERKRGEALLHAREQEFRAFVENATDQIIRYDKEFRRTYVNPAVTQAYGLPREAFIGKSVGSVVEDAGLEPDIDTVTAIRRQIKSVFDTGEPMESEVSFPSPSGRRTYWTRMYPEFDLNGVVINVMTISREITERQRAEETIRKSEQLLREAESLGHTGSWEKNLVTGEIFHTEENLRLFFGDDRSSSKVTFLADYNQAIHPDDREYVMQRRVQLLAEGGPRDIEFRVVWPDGSVHILFSRATVVYDELGKALRVYGTNVDITERKAYEATLNSLLHISQNLHRNLETDKLLEALIIEAMILTDSKLGWVGLPTEKGMTLVRHVSHNFEVLPFEYTWPPNVGWPGWVLVHKVPYVSNDADSDNVIVPEIRERFGVKSGIDTPILDAEGNILGFFEVNNKTNSGGYGENDVELLLAVSRIASVALQNASSYQNLQRTEESIKSLSLRLMNMQESERRALTTELHDRIGQNLTGLGINLQNMKALLSDEAAKPLATKFDDAQALVEHTTRQIRDIMAELHPPELEDYGLAVALETYAERAASRGNLELIAGLPDLAPPSLPSDVRIALFRAAQEAISNVLKHAYATQLEVSLEERNGRIILAVEDNGSGFEPEAVSQRGTQTWGLKIMQERIESIGGKVQIKSKMGQGTRVVFEIGKPS
jgi:PAS domain S-box-containing protein